MNINTLTELAFAHCILSSSLSASVVPFNVYHGLGHDDKAGPAVIITAVDATPDFQGAGAPWHTKLELKCKEIAFDSSSSSSFASDVFDVLASDATRIFLRGYPGYYCHDLFVQDSTVAQHEDAWVQTVTLDVICVLT
jgi:hypothetical protein